MDYEAVRAQVLALLQQEQRLSYRVLKRQLQLDDDTLEDLKEDLIYAKKLAVDEDGRVLVWIGAPGTPSGQQGASAGVALRQRVQQRLGLLQVGRVKPFREPAVHGFQELPHLIPL